LSLAVQKPLDESASGIAAIPPLSAAARYAQKPIDL
jgi:hypothetical protein